MREPGRVRRLAKYAVLILTGVLVAAVLISHFRMINFYTSTTRWRWALGTLLIEKQNLGVPGFNPSWGAFRGWHIRSTPFFSYNPLDWQYWPRAEIAALENGTRIGTVYVAPMTPVVLLLIAICIYAFLTKEAQIAGWRLQKLPIRSDGEYLWRVPRMREPNMRWLDLAFLPGVAGGLLLLAYAGHEAEAYLAMYPLLIIGAVLFVLGLRRKKHKEGL